MHDIANCGSKQNEEQTGVGAMPQTALCSTTDRSSYFDWVMGKIGMSRGESVVVAVWTISMSDSNHQLPLPKNRVNVQVGESVRESGRKRRGWGCVCVCVCVPLVPSIKFTN